MSSEENKKTSKISYLLDNVWTVPNVLTFIRILLVPVFAVLFLKGSNDRSLYIWALVVLAVSGLTDFFDGKIARRFNQISALGKLLDPVADKLTEITLAVIFFITFLRSSDAAMHTFAWIFLLFIAKELFMIIVGAVMISKGIHPCASEIYGKAATFVFYVVMVLLIAFGPEVGILSNLFILPPWIMWSMVVLSVILTFVALFSYVPGTYGQFKEYWAKKAEKEKDK